MPSPLKKITISESDCSPPAPGGLRASELATAMIENRIRELSESFSHNCAKAAQRTHSVSTDLSWGADLAGLNLPGAHIAGNKLTIKSDFYSLTEFLKICPDARKRRTRYQEYASLTRSSGNNLLLAKQLLKESQNLAQAEGYRDYLELICADKMIKNPKRISQFLAQVRRAWRPAYEKNYKKLACFARQEFGMKTVAPEDFFYVCPDAAETLYSRKNEFKNYFDLSHVKKHFLAYIEKIFMVRFVPINGEGIINSYWLYDQREKRPLARIIFDLTSPTQGRQLSAYVQNKPVRRAANSKIPEIDVVLKFAADRATGLQLLDFSTLRIFFHEIGHLLEHAYVQNAPARPAELDVLEFYSKFMENFAYDWEFIHALSFNPRTGRKIPRRVFEAAVAHEQFSNSFDNIELLNYATKDFLFHTASNFSELTAVDRRLTDLCFGRNKFPTYNLFYETDPQIFPDNPDFPNYRTNYYTFILGEYVAREVFKKFKSQRSLLRPGLGGTLREKIFAQSGRRSFFDSYCDFTNSNELTLTFPESERSAPSRSAATK